MCIRDRANIQSNVADLGVFGNLFLSYGFMTYLAILLAFMMFWFFKHTHVGLNLRAVGENPATADACGINVTKYKYLATCVGAGITGLGGLYYVMDYTKGTWANDGSIETVSYTHLDVYKRQCRMWTMLTL